MIANKAYGQTQAWKLLQKLCDIDYSDERAQSQVTRLQELYQHKMYSFDEEQVNFHHIPV